MNRIIRWYNTNKKAILVKIVVIIFILVMIKLVNSLAHTQLNIQEEKINKTDEITNTIWIESDESAVSGKNLSKSQKDSLKTLDEFANYCNIGDIDNAYKLVSEDCKKEIYPTEELFKINYYDPIFAGKKKDISAENWIENIYIVHFKEDPISTGILEDKNAIQDYITIVQENDGNIKLNINGYIGKEKIDVAKSQDELEIKVVESNVYMDYQTFTYEITNNSNKSILLNDPMLNSRMYIEDKNGIQYQAYTHEIAQSQLIVTPKETKKLTMKYYNRYSSNKIIKSIVFARIILDYDVYSNYQDVAYYNDYGAIQINL